MNEAAVTVLYSWVVTAYRLASLFLTALASSALTFPAARAQDPSPAEKLTHEGSLGLKFVAVPGTPVLFATHETRVSDWQAFLQASGHEFTYKPHFEQGPDHPAVGITLADARAFCLWLTEKDRAEGKLNTAQSYRLPTRADWDAAIGLLRTRKPDLTVEEKVGDERTFPWGMDWPPPAKAGNFAEDEIPGYQDSFPFTAPVGQFTSSTEGLYDLAGNVWEWNWDPEIRAEQVGVLRGGSWAYFRPETLRSSYLYTVPVDMRMPTIGFRCVFEDKQRTATLLAAAEKVKAEIRTQRREEIMGGAVAKEDVAAMKEKLAAGSGPVAPLSTIPVKPAVPGEKYTNSLGLEFVPLPGTALLFGSTEVRAQDFETWLKDIGRVWEKKPPFLANGSHPAVGVTWDEATAFCQWLTDKDRAAKLISPQANYRLPTDAEWSLAAGLHDDPGTTPAEKAEKAGNHFPWSAEGAFPPPRSSTNLDATRLDGYFDSYSYTAPVTTEAANSLGILGLGGNAAEWCQDPWPGAAEERTVRGGSWLSRDKETLRSGHRQHAPRDSRNNSFGFRAVLEIPAP